jgi:hypothetical protein
VPVDVEEEEEEEEGGGGGGGGGGVQIPVAWSPRATGILYGGD